MINKLFKKLTYTQIIVLSFFVIILLGTLLLCLPVSSRSGSWTPFADSLFTATSATCVTGLIVKDTATYWSLFGQIVILLMIQIGGLGFMSVVTMFSIFMKRYIGLGERKLLMQSAGTVRTNGVVALIRRVFIGTLLFEGAGSILLATRFIPRMGFARGIYNAVFHSVSAFCNAGFDLMGKYKQFSSFTEYAGDITVNITLISLIIIGGIGFFVWQDIIKHKWHFKSYELHTKIVLISTAVLIIGSWMLFYYLEHDASLKDLSGSQKFLASLFCAVTPRTAGFNTVNLASMSDSASILTTVLMFIGGSPGSTAGGIKTTTAAVMLLSAFAAAKKESHITVFKRRLDDAAIKQATAVVSVYITAVIAAVITICAIEPYGMRDVIFEVVSAIGTVGLTMGITPSLTVISHIILMILMFFGRVGGLSLMLMFAEKRVYVPLERPVDKILIG